jgi:hypothetical protein
MINACKIVVKNAEEEKSLGRPRRGWYDNIKMYYKQWRILVNTAMELVVL